MSYCQSIPKFEFDTVCEDSSCAFTSRIAVADGAGGSGIFAAEWSRYLIKKLPKHPISDFDTLKNWMQEIWEPFYRKYSEIADESGGFIADKFFEMGSYSTLAAAWKKNDNVYWIAYGDSVVFHYNPSDNTLEYSFTCLKDFSSNPFLLNWKKDPIVEKLQTGEFRLSPHSLVFIASDALAHYLLASWFICNGNFDKLTDSLKMENNNSQIISNLSNKISKDFSFYENILTPLIETSKNKRYFVKHMRMLFDDNLISSDDYSFAIFSNKR